MVPMILKTICQTVANYAIAEYKKFFEENLPEKYYLDFIL